MIFNIVIVIFNFRNHKIIKQTENCKTHFMYVHIYMFIEI